MVVCVQAVVHSDQPPAYTAQCTVQGTAGPLHALVHTTCKLRPVGLSASANGDCLVSV
jgi:hypothetical protein